MVLVRQRARSGLEHDRQPPGSGLHQDVPLGTVAVFLAAFVSLQVSRLSSLRSEVCAS